MNAMIQAVQQRASQFDRMILTAIVLVASIFPIELVPGSMPAPKGADGQYSGKQGQIILVKVTADEPQAEVRGTFMPRLDGDALLRLTALEDLDLAPAACLSRHPGPLIVQAGP